MNNRLESICQTHLSLSCLTKGLFAVTFSLLMVACSSRVASTSQPGLSATSEETAVATQPKDTSVTDNITANTITQATRQTEQTSQNSDARYAEVGDDGEPDEPLTANIERLNLQPGTSYSEVRSLVMAEGWMPYTEAEGAIPDLNSSAVQELHAQGFPEAETCSGTGQGFCSFLFIHVNQIDFPDARLQIITTPESSSLSAEPNFYNWDMWDYELKGDETAQSSVNQSNAVKDDSSSYQYLEANALYETQTLSAGLYREVLSLEQDCILLEDCSNSRYLFEDVLLTFSTNEFGSVVMTVIPHSSVSRTEALNYAQILDIDDEIDFTDGLLVDNYEGGELPPEGRRMTESFFTADPPGEGYATTKMVRLISRPGEDIFQVEFEIIVL